MECRHRRWRPAELVASYPLREQLVGLFMRALHASGRQADALATYQHTRAHLADQLGIDPGPELQRLHTAILRHQTDPAAAAATTIAPALEPARCTLPADQAVFVGRDRELEQIATAVEDAAMRGGVIAIHAIDGMPGIGKTTLAVHVAHRLKDRFGDRQLFVDLHAHTSGRPPADPSDVLAELLSVDGVDPRFLPPTLDGRAGLWRDRMAEKRLLLVLDNAAGTEQVAPLLLGSTDCLVLVTSRRSLGDLPAAALIPLDVLVPHEAIAMFVRLAPRAAAHIDAVANLVHACGYLPLAISITASLFLRHRSWSVDDLVREVHGSAGGLLTLTAENRTVAAVFDLSYQHLPPERQRFFRLLGLHPGVDIDPYAAAALAGTSLEEAQRHLDGLHGDHLLEEPTYHRYRMHDLVRAHAASLAAGQETQTQQRETLNRLLDYYRHTAATAMDVAYPYERQRRPTIPPVGTPTPQLAGQTRADHWLEAELANLLAAAQHGRPEHTWQLSSILDRYLRTHGRNRDAETLHRQALDLALRLGNHPAEMNALNSLGSVHWRLGGYEQAGDHFGRALRIAHTIGDPIGELTALHGLGSVHYLLGGYEQAADHFGRALHIAHTIGDRIGELTALHGLGSVHRTLGRYEQAGDHFGQTLEIARIIGDHSGTLDALLGFATVHWAMGRFERAGEQFGQALRFAEDIGARGSELIALAGLGDVHRLLGRYEQAGDLLGRALRIARDISARSGELQALAGLGQVHRLAGRHGEAADCYQQVFDIARRLGSANWQFEALQGLGRLHCATGRPDLALTDHEQALRHAIDLAQPADQSRAHDGLAHAHHALNDHDQARLHWQQALDILTGLGTEHTEDIEASVRNIRAHLTEP